MVSVVPEAAFPGILCISPLRQEGTARHYKKDSNTFFCYNDTDKILRVAFSCDICQLFGESG